MKSGMAFIEILNVEDFGLRLTFRLTIGLTFRLIVGLIFVLDFLLTFRLTIWLTFELSFEFYSQPVLSITSLGTTGTSMKSTEEYQIQLVARNKSPMLPGEALSCVENSIFGLKASAADVVMNDLFEPGLWKLLSLANQ